MTREELITRGLAKPVAARTAAEKRAIAQKIAAELAAEGLRLGDWR